MSKVYTSKCVIDSYTTVFPPVRFIFLEDGENIDIPVLTFLDYTPVLQTIETQNAASDRGIHCLLTEFLWKNKVR